MNADLLLSNFERISEAPDAVPRLRRFILDLAVRGKRVPQDPNDEPASELLEQIQLEKARLLRNEEIKRLEAFKQIEQDEIPFDTPPGWVVTRMGCLTRKLGAGSTPLGGKSVYQSEGVPFLRSQNVHNSGLRLDDVALISRVIHDRMSATHIQHQDILLNITGASIGRCALVPSSFVEGNVSQHVAIIRLFLPSIREFIHLSLTSPFYQKVIDEVQVGVSREGLSMQRLRLFPMLLPPLAEQHRIVAKVDELMALCDRLEAAQEEQEKRRDRLVASSLQRLNQPGDAPTFHEHARFHLHHLPRLTTRPKHIQQLRQTILTLAIRGKLVPQDPTDEPACQLLARISAQKNEGTNERTGRDWIGDITRPVERAFIAPDGWVWTRIANAVKRVTVGYVGPMTDQYVENGIPFLRSQNVRANRFREEGLISISPKFHESIAKSALAPGDVVVVRSGNVGTACVIPRSLKEANCSDLVVVKKPIAVLPQYLCFYLNSLASAHIEAGTVGIALTHFNTKSVATMPLPLPPLAEQHRIIAKAEELLNLCDGLEAQLTTSHTQHQCFLEALLHEALTPAM